MSRRTLALWGLAVGLLLGVTSQGFAQGRGGFGRGMGGGGGLMGLALLEPVQKELGLDKESAEVAEIRKMTEAMGKEVQDEMSKLTGGDPMAFFNMSQEERQKMMTKMNEVNAKLTAKYIPDMKKLLSAEQYTRLQQISWQQAGTGAFADAEVAKTLELSKEQQEKLAAVNTEFGNKQRELFQSAFQGGGGGGGGGFEEMQKKMAELTATRDKQANEILSKEQLEKFTKLKGKEFDLALLRPQGGRGGFGGGGGGGFGGGGGRNAGRPGAKKAEDKKEESKPE